MDYSILFYLKLEDNPTTRKEIDAYLETLPENYWWGESYLLSRNSFCGEGYQVYALDADYEEGWSLVIKDAFDYLCNKYDCAGYVLVIREPDPYGDAVSDEELPAECYIYIKDKEGVAQDVPVRWRWEDELGRPDIIFFSEYDSTKHKDWNEYEDLDW